MSPIFYASSVKVIRMSVRRLLVLILHPEEDRIAFQHIVCRRFCFNQLICHVRLQRSQLDGSIGIRRPRLRSMHLLPVRPFPFEEIKLSSRQHDSHVARFDLLYEDMALIGFQLVA